MVNALLDTNILIDFLNGRPQARDEIKRYDKASISLISWIEVIVGTAAENDIATRDFLDSFTMVPIDLRVAERAATLRRLHGTKLPDALIWASAEVHSLLLVTRNTKDFPPDMPGVRLPYVVT